MTFEEEFEKAPLKSILVSVRGAREDRHAGFDPGRMIEGCYRVVAGEVIMCDARGHEVVDHDGRKYRRKFSNESGKLNERETASLLVKDLKSRLKIAGADRVGGFEFGPLHYPKANGCLY
jgi:hypothetical protein